MIEDFLQLPVAAMAVVVLTLLGGLVVVATFFTGIIHQYFAFKMLFALQRVSPDTFRHVTTFCGVGPWASNPVRFFQFLRGPDFDSDCEVGPLKARCRVWTRRVFRFFIIFGVIFALDALAMGILAITHHGG
jgi:hypothetical protein